MVRLKKRQKAGANVRFIEIEDGDPRNAAISTDQMETAAGENGVNFADREVLISKAILRRTDWRKKPCGEKPNNRDCACIIDTGFSGGALCSFNWMYRYEEHLRAINPKIPKMNKSAERRLKFVVCASRFGRLRSFYYFRYF